MAVDDQKMWLHFLQALAGKVAGGSNLAVQTNYNDYRAQKFQDIQRAIAKYDENLIFITNPAGQPVEVPPVFTGDIPYDYVNTISWRLNALINQHVAGCDNQIAPGGLHY